MALFSKVLLSFVHNAKYYPTALSDVQITHSSIQITSPNIYLSLTECVVCTISYGFSFFLALWPKPEAHDKKREREKKERRIHNLWYGPSNLWLYMHKRAGR